MTMPDERARALVWAGGFLLELIRDPRIPDDVKLKAKRIARHFPCVEDVSCANGTTLEGCLELAVPDKQALKQWTAGLAHGPLTWNTRAS